MSNIFELIDTAETTEMDRFPTDAESLQSLNAELQTPPLYATYRGKKELARALLAAMPEPDLYSAAACGTAQQIASILASGWEVDSLSPDGFTPLALAAAFNDSSAVRALLASGANPNARCRSLGGVAPLHAAVFGRSLDNVRTLLERGADPNLTQQGEFSAIHGAAQNGDQAMCRLLIEHGAMAGQKTADGKTPADFAKASGLEDLEAFLIDQAN